MNGGCPPGVVLQGWGYESPSLNIEWDAFSLGTRAEMLFEQMAGACQALFRKHYRLG